MESLALDPIWQTTYSPISLASSCKETEQGYWAPQSRAHPADMTNQLVVAIKLIEDAIRLLEEGGVTGVEYERYVQIVQLYNEARVILESRLKGL